MTIATDEELMAQTARGDRAAFGGLIDRHKDSLVNYLTHLAGRREVAEDLAQEAFLRLFRAAPGYRDEGRLLPFLFRIATNLLRSELRRERGWRALGAIVRAAPPCSTPAPSPGELLLQRELRTELRRAIARLPWSFRVPLVLAEIENWSGPRIAALLGCREGTVKSRLHRARGMLRRDLAHFWNGDQP